MKPSLVVVNLDFIKLLLSAFNDNNNLIDPQLYEQIKKELETFKDIKL